MLPRHLLYSRIRLYSRVFVALLVSITLFAGTASAQGWICNSNSVAIPDGDFFGSSSSIVLEDIGTIADINLSVTFTHARTGHVSALLTHEDSGTSIWLMDRPGYPAVIGGCAAPLSTRFFLDSATGGAIEAACPPADIRFAPDEPLSTFFGENSGGTWTVTVLDVDAGNAGSLDEWCILVDGGSLPWNTYGATSTGETNAPAFDIIDITGTGVMVANGDDVTSLNTGIFAPVDLAIAFPLFGQSYTQMVPATNGYITTDTTNDTGPDLSNDCPLARYPSTPNDSDGARLYPLHDDMIATIYHQSFAVCPRPLDDSVCEHACEIFHYRDMSHFAGADTWEMQVVLYENGDIVYQYGGDNAGLGHTGNPEEGSSSSTGLSSAFPATQFFNFPDNAAPTCNTAGSIPHATDSFAIWMFLDFDGNDVADSKDTDCDGSPDLGDECINDPDKDAAGVCGCGTADVDSDGDGTFDCDDQCVNDPNKDAAGVCGCGTADVDSDGDGAFDCDDQCVNDSSKTVPGACGCGSADVDANANNIADCLGTQDLNDQVSVLDGLVKKLRPNKRQKALKKSIREALAALSAYVDAQGAGITVAAGSKPLATLAKQTKRKGKKALRNKLAAFKANKRKARKALKRLGAALA